VGRTLIEVARAAQGNAHAPYSDYPVGAALETDDGRVFAGANIENASLGLTNCAERVALGAAVAQGARAFRRLVIVTRSEPPAAPCGACRQALAEFGLDLTVESVGRETTKQWTLRELLPDAFRAGDLIE
jgi:cytidine deaminase